MYLIKIGQASLRCTKFHCNPSETMEEVFFNRPIHHLSNQQYGSLLQTLFLSINEVFCVFYHFFIYNQSYPIIKGINTSGRDSYVKGHRTLQAGNQATRKGVSHTCFCRWSCELCFISISGISLIHKLCDQQIIEWLLYTHFKLSLKWNNKQEDNTW